MVIEISQKSAVILSNTAALLALYAWILALTVSQPHLHHCSSKLASTRDVCGTGLLAGSEPPCIIS